MIPIDSLKIKIHFSLSQALIQLDKTGRGILLLVNDEQQLIRTITDGDIRRLLISGASLQDQLTLLPYIKPTIVINGTSSTEAYRLMQKYSLNYIPVLDECERPIDLFSIHDFQIHLSEPHLGDFELNYVSEAFSTNWIAPLGPNVDAFENSIAEYVGVKYAAALSSGTAAIHLALRILGVTYGDIVFCSTFTFIASANPILYQGATPVFIDSEPFTWNMSPAALKRAFKDSIAQGRLPKAVIVVSLYGQSADMDPLIEICQSYGIPIIEDAAESLGSTYKGRFSGSLGDIGIYSFNGNKIITTSGGGMLVSNNKSWIDTARFLSTQARDSAPYYEHTQIGYNYRMSNVLAGIGRGQLQALEERVASRRLIFWRYQTAFANTDFIKWMPDSGFGRSTRWLTTCTLDLKIISPAQIIETLAKKNIEARHVWKPMHQQPLFQGCAYYPHDPEMSVSDHLFKTGLCLPSSSNLIESQQQRVIDVIRSFG